MISKIDISELESVLLADSTVADMEWPADITQDDARVLTAAQVQHDVSVFARALINVYGAWPFLDELERRRMLVALRRIQTNAHNGMTAADLFAALRPIIEQTPDCHLHLGLGTNRAGTTRRKPGRDVGKNIAGQDVVKLEMRGDVAVIAIRVLHSDYKQYFEPLKPQVTDMLRRSSALIVDLRGNGGGSSRPTDELAAYLYGARVPMAKKVYIRATPDSVIVHRRKKRTEWIELNDDSGTALWVDASDKLRPAFESENPGYHHPIYVLTDWRTMSSAEMFCTKIKPHPYVKFVGDNTRGGEVFGDVGNVYLPGSKIKFIFGCVCRELEQENFELNGYAPDIRVSDGVDAMDVAMKLITEQQQKNAMKITFRPMTAVEAWDFISESHQRYHNRLKAFGYDYNQWIPNHPELQEMFEMPKITPAQWAKYRDLFINHIYKEPVLHRFDSLLETAAVPTLHRVVETLTPFAKKWGVQFPKSVEILSTYGMGASYKPGSDPEIIFRMTRFPDDSARVLSTLEHEFIHLLIEEPIIQKYNVPQDLKERIVDIIGTEYFRPHVQSKFENSFANKYITRAAIENDLPNAVQKMMTDFAVMNQKMANTKGNG